MNSVPPSPRTSLRLLTGAEVASLVPSAPAQVELAAAALTAAANGRAQAPPKPSVHPRPGAFVHAMPAFIEEMDALAIKWVSGYPDNPARGLPYLSAIVITNDADTGLPTAIMDGAALTAARTAAVSAVCANRWAPDGWSRMAVVGLGVQGKAHAKLFRALHPALTINGYDVAGVDTELIASVNSPQQAMRNAEVLVTAVPMHRKATLDMSEIALSDRWLILPIDFDASLDPGLLRKADAFLVDDLDQYRHYKEQGWFGDWPDPDGVLGVELDGTGRPARTVCVNLGLAAVDAAFATVIHRNAVESAIGTLCLM